MKVLSTSILGRHIGGGSLMFNPMHGTPIMHRFGNLLTIVTHKYFEVMISLVHYHLILKL